MADPWQCPACKTWIRGEVTEHRCPPQEGVVAVPTVWPGGAPGSTTISTAFPPGTIITTNYAGLPAGARSIDDARVQRGLKPWGLPETS